MYSVVLMAALTTGGGAPDWCHHHGHGYYGGWPGEWAPNCHGVYGGSYYGIPCGGYGCSGYGCSGCSGCWGCYGGYWGGMDYNCFGCHGGCYGCYGGCVGYGPVGPAITPEPIPAPKEEKKGGSGALTPSRAKVIVQLPNDAKLYVDDQPIKTSDERQTFSTPQLDRGQTYYYEVRAEAVRDGKTVTETKRVLIRAGEEVTVSFPKLAPPTADVAAAASSGR
jgi:uncharacterized protein (TIGR03000 family)